MKFFPLLAAVFLSACATDDHYTKLTVTDFKGHRLATWVAEGKVSKVDQGYRIRAVERQSGPPNEVSNRYPNGWKVNVVGPNIIKEPVEKPDWLKELDGE